MAVGSRSLAVAQGSRVKASRLERASTRQSARGAVRLIAGAALFAALALIALVGLGCSTRERPDVSEGPVGSQPEQISRGFALTQTREGRIQWELKAATGEIFEGGDIVELTDLRVDFFDSTSAKEGTLTAKHGKIRQKENKMEVDGDVVLVAKDGSTLKTTHLVWSDEENRITTDAFVEITRSTSTLTGYGLVATPDLTMAEVQREVKLVGERAEP
jgi:LPS export ABC transporter protein LptC